MAFLRANYNNPITTQLVVAEPDGRNERLIATRIAPAPHFITSLMPGRPSVAPAWSPDARLIAATGVEGSGTVYKALFVSTLDGLVVTAPHPSGYSGIAWIGSSSLVISQPATEFASQLWRLSYPAGQVSRLTNDLSAYSGVSLTADRTALVTGRREELGSIWIGDQSAASGTETSQPVANSAFTIGGAIAWAGSRLVFTTMPPVPPALLAVSPGSSASEQIVGKARSPVATTDGATIVYVSMEADHLGTLWKLDTNSGRSTQLAPGNNFRPVITPDDQFVVFMDGGNRHPWMVPLAGGPPTRISDVISLGQDVSPNGKLFAFTKGEDGRRFSMVVCALPACTNMRQIVPLESPTALRWLPDGQSIAYAPTGARNIWVQPLDGSRPRQLTHFKDGRTIIDFAWSRDGKRLAIARVATSNDIVLVKGFASKP